MVKRKMNSWLWVLVILAVIIVVLTFCMRGSETPVRLNLAVDGDTILLTNGKMVKLMGVTASVSGQELAKEYLTVLLSNRNMWLEYDTGNAWVWIGCEGSPKFSPFQRKDQNPVGCKKGVLANKQLMKIDWSR